MKSMLMLTSVASMVDQFFIPHIELLIRMGYKVDVACNFESGSTCTDKDVERLKKQLEGMNVDYYQIDFDRSITNLKGNYKAYKQVKKIILDNKYQFIHCHSPIGGVIGRLVGKSTKTKVLYTAHGFHFHKKSPRANWIIYYTAEKLCSYLTDGLITINEEDYTLAKRKMKAKNVFYIPGIGIDFNRDFLPNEDKGAIRREIGIPEDAFLLTSVGELSHRKNHRVIIEAISKLKNNNIHFAIMGKGSLENELRELSKSLGLEDRIHFLGYRNDVIRINYSADAFCFPSRIEGLGIAALEAMASEIPVITSDIHGINDYSINGKTGFKCGPDDVDGFAKAIKTLIENEELRKEMGAYAREKTKEFDLTVVLDKLEEIYSM